MAATIGPDLASNYDSSRLALPILALLIGGGRRCRSTVFVSASHPVVRSKSAPASAAPAESPAAPAPPRLLRAPRSPPDAGRRRRSTQRDPAASRRPPARGWRASARGRPPPWRA